MSDLFPTARRVEPFGVDEIRACARVANNTTESVNQRYSAEQLLLLYRAYRRSEFDISWDRWTESEIAAALAGSGAGAEDEDR